MKLLVIGGTSDGRKLASELHCLGFSVTYSIAGLVRKTKLPCAVISGGFTQFGGLKQYVIENNITHLIDGTHPFAEKMSNTIAKVSAELNIESVRFHRLPWQKTDRDQWVEVNGWADVLDEVSTHKSVFITAGQVTQSVIDALASQIPHLLLRTAMPVNINLPSNVTWIKAIGPFELETEQALIKAHHIDAIISKNSGGESTYAKMQAAAGANICVYQFKRPLLAPTSYQFDCLTQCVDFIVARSHNGTKNEI